MIDQKVYKTDYISEFSEFLNEISLKDEPVSIAKTAEIKIYTKVNKLRDNAGITDNRNKLWEGF